MENETSNFQNQMQEKRKLGFMPGMIAGLALALVIVILVSLISPKRQKEVKQEPTRIGIVRDAAVSPEMIKKLQTLETTIDNYFYLDEKTNEELQNGIYRGLLEALDDPYSEYYTQEELNELMNQVSGIYYGIGAYVSIDTETSLPKISGIISNTPAEEAGLRENDLIYQVGDVSTYGLSLDEAVSYIRGEEGTQVTLTIIREGESDYLEVTATRRKVESPTVEYKMLEDGIGYIQIVEFDEVTPYQFADALATLRGSDMEKLILDLRGNPGGSLTDVVDIAGMLLPEGLVVYTENKNGKREEYFSDGTREIDIPMAVLVDMNSASASEILAGAIQDYGKGTLVGTTTFGKGIVQQIIPFADGSAVKITVSSYYTPKGRNIHGTGIEPDIICEFDGEAYYGSEERPDNQLEKAKEVLRGTKEPLVSMGEEDGATEESEEQLETIEIDIEVAEGEAKETISIEAVTDAAVNQQMVQKLQVLEAAIDDYFYLEEKTNEELQEGVYKGLFEALDDPYSEYYTKEEIDVMLNQLSGVYYGIGAHVSIDEATSLPKISGIISNAPAEEAGLRVNDLIYQIGDVPAYGLSLEEAKAYVRGAEGTKVTLTILREGEEDYLEITVTRRKVENLTVEYEMLEDSVGYIHITEFSDVTPRQFADAMEALRNSHMDKLILDLRGNPGGDVIDAVNIAGMLLPEGLVTYTENKNGEREDYISEGTEEITIPMVVLVDSNTASAAEILAGAIQDYEKGTLVGTTTFGKGVIQNILSFSDGSAAKITVSGYYTPNGRNINGTGIEPDVICEFDAKAFYGSEERPDNQLEKAKEVLRNE